MPFYFLIYELVCVLYIIEFFTYFLNSRKKTKKHKPAHPFFLISRNKLMINDPTHPALCRKLCSWYTHAGGTYFF